VSTTALKTIHARIVSSEHGRVLDDAKGEVIRGLEVVECARAHARPGGGVT
jgi:malonate-semialdehyde dehydrogenase (acetylating)/methylmalonate-semialdehyde dehydrogenase